MVNLVTTIGLQPKLLDAFIRHYKKQGFESKGFHIVVWGKSEKVNFEEIEKVLGWHDIKVYEDMRDEPMTSNILTQIYNNVTSTKPNDWWSVADIDEFQVYNQSGWHSARYRSDISLKSTIKFCEDNKYDFNLGKLVDRFGVDGKLSDFEYGDNLFEIFPNVGNLSHRIRGNDLTKVVLQKGHINLGGGQHVVLLENGREPTGDEWLNCSRDWSHLIPVHHFCWTSETSKVKLDMIESEMDVGNECQKVFDFIDGENRINLDNKEYFVEENQTSEIMDIRALNRLFINFEEINVIGTIEDMIEKYQKFDFVMSTLFLQDPYRVKQWVEYHLLLGVQHFYLYYHGRLEDLQKIFPRDYKMISDYVDKGIVTLIEWNCGITYINEQDKYLFSGEDYLKAWHYAQHAQIQHITSQVCNKTRWIGNIDLDEFIVLRDHISLIEYTEYLNKKDIKVASIPELLCKLDKDVTEQTSKVRRFPTESRKDIQYHSFVEQGDITKELEVFDFNLNDFLEYNTHTYEHEGSFTKYIWNCEKVNESIPLVHDIMWGYDSLSEKGDEYPNGKLGHEIIINHYNYGKTNLWLRKLKAYKAHKNLIENGMTEVDHEGENFNMENFDANDYGDLENNRIRAIIKYHLDME